VRAGQGRDVVGPVHLSSYDRRNASQRITDVLSKISRDLIRLSEFDYNDDGVVDNDELVVLLVENYNTLEPATRPCMPFDSEENIPQGEKKKNIRVLASIIGPLTPFYQIAHEIFHTIGLDHTSDLRSAGGDDNRLLTIMGGYFSNTSDDQRSVHLDGYHKFVLGWSEPRVRQLTTPGLARIPANTASNPNTAVLLWKPGTEGIFLLEYRTPRSIDGLAYDENVAGSEPGVINEGLAIWRAPTPSKDLTEHLGSPDLERAGENLWQPGQVTPTLRWADDTPTGVRIQVDSIEADGSAIHVSWWNDDFPLFIYGIKPDGRLTWYRHNGYLAGGGLESWGAGPVEVGHGWGDALHAFAAEKGIIYAVAPNGELRWYRHNGYTTGGGLETWEPQDSDYKVVGSGWAGFKHIFWGGDGIIYAVTPGGELRWYRHYGYQTGGGLETWHSSGYKTVGQGWGHYLHLFSGGRGIIYAVHPDGELRWFKHNGYLSGEGLETWEPQDTGFKKVGSSWHTFKQVFWAGDGIIYGIKENGDLRWYRHDEYLTGSADWSGNKSVGRGWQNFNHVFCMRP
jgi:hypothetical protein